MKLSNKSGFTLLEIIIVIIIVGVLASLALPRFFSTIEFARGTEALNAMGGLKRAADRCALMSNNGRDYANCGTIANIGADDPGLTPGAHFSYTAALAGDIITITADRNTNNGGNDDHMIELELDVTTGAVTRSGNGAFSGVH